jgi:hypothetical protein
LTRRIRQTFQLESTLSNEIDISANLSDKFFWNKIITFVPLVRIVYAPQNFYIVNTVNTVTSTAIQIGQQQQRNTIQLII